MAIAEEQKKKVPDLELAHLRSIPLAKASQWPGPKLRSREIHLIHDEALAKVWLQKGVKNWVQFSITTGGSRRVVCPVKRPL